MEVNWGFATSFATVMGAVIATVVGTVELLAYKAEQEKNKEEQAKYEVEQVKYEVEQAKYEAEQLKHSPRTKYNVIKEAMLQSITVKPIKYPEVDVPEHVDLLNRLIFSERPHLCLIEGAQGRSLSLFFCST